MTEYRVLQPPEDIFRHKKENPLEVLVALKDEYPITGGSWRYYKGEKYPIKGCVYQDALNDLTIVKGLAKPIVKILLENKWLPILLKFLPSLRRSAVKNMVWYIDKTLRKHYLETRRYCPSGQELEGATKEAFDGETEGKFVDFLIFFWQTDIPYRFKGQDFFGIVNKKRLLENPAEELKRAISKVRLRETAQGTYITRMIDTVSKLLYALLKSNNEFRKKIIRFFSLLDFEKMQMDKYDLYYALRDKHYDFLGLNLQTRLQLKDTL